MSRADEREIIIGATDADCAWHVYADVPSRFARTLLAVAAAWGVTPRPLGHGIEAELPFLAIRILRPRRLTEAERAQRRRAAEAAQKARNRSRTHRAPVAARGSPPEAEAEGVPPPDTPSAAEGRP